MNRLTDAELIDLEVMIDRRGISEVMCALVHIASEKAEHVRSNWGDQRLARDWDNLADGLISQRVSTLLNRIPS